MKNRNHCFVSKPNQPNISHKPFILSLSKPNQAKISCKTCEHLFSLLQLAISFSCLWPLLRSGCAFQLDVYFKNENINFRESLYHATFHWISSLCFIFWASLQLWFCEKQKVLQNGGRNKNILLCLMLFILIFRKVRRFIEVSPSNGLMNTCFKVILKVLK